MMSRVRSDVGKIQMRPGTTPLVVLTFAGISSIILRTCEDLTAVAFFLLLLCVLCALCFCVVGRDVECRKVKSSSKFDGRASFTSMR